MVGGGMGERKRKRVFSRCIFSCMLMGWGAWFVGGYNPSMVLLWTAERGAAVEVETSGDSSFCCICSDVISLLGNPHKAGTQILRSKQQISRLCLLKVHHLRLYSFAAKTIVNIPLFLTPSPP